MGQPLQKHRNCKEIRTLYQFWLKHFRTDSYLDQSRDIEVDPALLPDGQTPIWVDCPGQSQVAALQFVERTENLPQEVTVIYKEHDQAAEQFCEERDWKYQDFDNIRGIESKAVILLDSVWSEHITRAMSLLVIVTITR